MSRIGSSEHDPSPRPGRAIARCSPGCSSVSSAHRNQVDRQLRRRAPALYAAGKGRGPRGHDPRQAGSTAARKERRSRRPERGPCRPCRPADRDAEKPGRHDRIPRILMACRKTAVSARRIALQMIHNTIVCAPDALRDQLRNLTRMQLVRTLASWRPDLTAYRDLDSAYRIGLKSLARRYLELHDEIADLDVMIAAIVNELAPNLVARNSIGHIGAAQLLLTAGDNPERLRSEASFASLCGVARFRHRREKRSATGSTAAEIRRKQRITHHRHRALTDRSANQGLCCSSDRRRPFQTRRHSSVEALPRERSLHAHHATSQGNQRHPNRRLTNRRASAVRNTLRSLSALAARKPAFVHRQARSATPTTMRCARVSSPPSNAS